MTPDITSAQRRPDRPGGPIIYLVDEDPSFLRALSRRLRAEGYQVECFGSAEEFLSSRRRDVPGCAVLDLQMPGPSGLQLQETLAEGEEPLPVVFLTAHGDVCSSVRAKKGGALDFPAKPVRGDDLLEAVKRALDRGAVGREGRRKKREWRTRFERLSPREREVFVLVVRGLPNKQIADVLGISERTIKAHRGQVMHKMGVQSGAELGRAVEWIRDFFEPERQRTDERPTKMPIGSIRASAGSLNCPKRQYRTDRQLCDDYWQSSYKKCLPPNAPLPLSMMIQGSTVPCSGSCGRPGLRRTGLVRQRIFLHTMHPRRTPA